MDTDSVDRFAETVPKTMRRRTLFVLDQRLERSIRRSGVPKRFRTDSSTESPSAIDG
ncbi:hypothetical protein [Natronorubrum tibetense]|uniref:hypothetical protein n=1 Tax=Natronorubrum tibetense TaxID=63128 RepID=UPI0003717004|nr:hypothetical protein [Natronorubrum tibetense]